jgi:cyclophilin family peptidyl-prolyl cis-trans isomerase
LSDQKAELEKKQKAEVADFVAKHPGSDVVNLPGEDGSTAEISPEVRESRRELGKLNREHGKASLELSKETLKFNDEEYIPGMIKYAEFCHKQYVAEPNEANGGALVLLVKELYDNGNVDEAYAYCSDLVKNGFKSTHLNDYMAASAYSTNHFEEAAKYFDLAQQSGNYTNVSLIANKEEIETATKAWETEQKLRAEEAAKDDLPRVQLETDVGNIVIELFENEAPDTVGNFISLVESGYYDNTTFYSVVLTSHIFHGCKTEDNRSTPGYRIRCETDNPNKRFPFRGAITMFTHSKDQGGSIYTMSLRPAPHTFGYCTTFGRIVEGLDLLPKIAKVNLRFPTPGMVSTKVNKATVLRKREHEYKPNKVE